MIMGDKIYINFIKFDFEEAIYRLKHQLSKIVVLENTVFVEPIKGEDSELNKEENKEPLKEENKNPTKEAYGRKETEDPYKENVPMINEIEKVERPDETKHELPTNVINWSDDQVKVWFESIECVNLYQSLKPCNGELLCQLYEMWNNAPEFFYQFVSLDNKLDRHSLLFFTNNFKKIFKA